jgi:hypothetical protein
MIRRAVRYRSLRHCRHHNPEAAGDLLMVIAVSSTLQNADKAAE